MKAELAFDVCWEVSRAREVLATKTSLGMTRCAWLREKVRALPAPVYAEDTPLQKMKRVGETEKFAGFGGRDAGVGGEPVEVIETSAGGPGRERRLAEVGETLLKAFEDNACAGIARGNGAARARIAAFKMNFANGEADGGALVFGKELILPEGWDAINFEGGTETLADVVDGKTGEPFNI